MICVALLGFLLWRASVLWDAVIAQLSDSPPWLELAAATLLSALAYLPLSIGWLLLLSVRITRDTLRGSLTIVLLSQAGRYLPGNVGHLIGKAFLTRNWLALPLARIGALLTLELLLCLLCAAIAGAVGIPFLIRALPQSTWPDAPWAWLLSVLALAAAAALAFLQPVRVFITRLELPSVGRSARATLAYGANVLLGAAAVWLLGTGVIPGAGLSFGAAVLAYSISWLAGFVTPGAPAGLGVREFVFMVILGPTIGESGALIIAGLLRLASVLGDIIAFGLGSWLKSRGNPKSAPDLRA